MKNEIDFLFEKTIKTSNDKTVAEKIEIKLLRERNFKYNLLLNFSFMFVGTFFVFSIMYLGIKG